MSKKNIFLLTTLVFFLLSLSIEASARHIVVYSARAKTLTRMPFQKYYRQTGDSIEVVTGSIDELLEKIKKEGDNPSADILLTVDAGSLWQAAQSGHFQSIPSDILRKNIPPHLRDPDNNWFGLSKRARTIVYSTERVKPEELSTYEDLALPKWKDRLCLRTAKKVYNQSLVAMMIAQHGVGKAEEIIKGWVTNLAEPPYPKDNGVIHAIHEGKCDVGIVNHYYFGRLIKADPSKNVALFWPNQGKNEGGVYIDISGAGILKNAENKAEAVKFLEWLSTEEAQNLFADTNMEYPVNPNVSPAPQVQAWGDFTQYMENILHSGENRKEAIELMDRVNYQ